MEVIFVDTETTGFKGPRLIELAYMREGDRLMALRCKPPIPIEEGAIAVHKITDDMLADLPAFVDRPEYPIIKDLFESNVVVAHSASYDLGVLASEGILPTLVLDTKTIARRMYPHIVNHKLQTLREYFHIEGGEAHSAGGDVLTLAGLFAQMRADLAAQGVDPEDMLSVMARG